MNLNTADQIAVVLIVTALAPFFVYETARTLWRWWDARFQAGVDRRLKVQRAEAIVAALCLLTEDEWAQVIAAGDAIDKDIEDAVIEAAELEMAAWFARGERA